MIKKSVNISDWYNDLIAAAKLAEHGPSKGSIIIRPLGYAIWENIQAVLNIKIKDLGGVNAYFPLFIPYSYLEREEAHVKGFSPELAVVTHGGGEKLADPLVVRPTSETIMYDAYSRWIQSYKDLPLIINQWNNAVRWEKRPYLFLRTTEFLWQEGHSVHADKGDNAEFVRQVLGAYVDTYQNYLGLYGYSGKKSESERFAGADQTLTYEMLMPDGKIIQGATSHDLGQNFAKVFKIKYQTKEKKEVYPYQASWGFSTRSIGALILFHGDDKGLVLPPAIAPTQVVIIPIVSKGADAAGIEKLAMETFKLLESYNLRVKLDNSDNSPGWKFNQYDLEGVTLRVEIGSSELKTKEVSVKPRDGGGGFVSKLDKLPERINEALDGLQSRLLEKSREFTKLNTHQADSYEQFKKIMNTTRGFIEAFWCEDPKCEEKIKEETKATTRCLPLDAIKVEGKCVLCGKRASYRWLFGQAY